MKPEEIKRIQREKKKRREQANYMSDSCKKGICMCFDKRCPCICHCRGCSEKL